MSDVKMERFELFQLLDTLARPGSEGAGQASADPAAVLAGLSGGEGRVFRVKLGYNPNSSSLGTSVVVLLWGIGLAGLLFQLVGTWLMAAQGGAPGGGRIGAPGGASGGGAGGAPGGGQLGDQGPSLPAGPAEPPREAP